MHTNCQNKHAIFLRWTMISEKKNSEPTKFKHFLRPSSSLLPSSSSLRAFNIHYTLAFFYYYCCCYCCNTQHHVCQCVCAVVYLCIQDNAKIKRERERKRHTISRLPYALVSMCARVIYVHIAHSIFLQFYLLLSVCVCV